MLSRIRKFKKLVFLIVLISAITFPASASASSINSASHNNFFYATSFFSNISNAFTNLFDKREKPNQHTDTKDKDRFSSWLKGNDYKKNKNWWDAHHNDSYDIWKKYYCY